MSPLIRPTEETDPEAATRLRAALTAVLAADPALAGATLGEMLRLVPGRRVLFAGQLAGVAAVFRHALSPAEAETCAAEWDELQRAHGAALARLAAGQGAAPVGRPLARSACGRVIVVAHVAGTPLLTHLWSLEAGAREAQILPAARWLADFTAPTEQIVPINRGPWRKWAEEAAARQPHAALARVEARVLQKMKKLSRGLQGADWRTAVCHGDFHPNNLILGQEGPTGIDLGGSRRAPVLRDVARFLTHMARRNMLPSGRRRFGVDAGACAAFVQALAMDETEATQVLPFMLAYECLVRVEHPQMSGDRLTHAQAMAEGLLEDLRQVA